MKFVIDAVFLTKELEMVHFEENMSPGKVSKYIKNCRYVLELEGGTISKFELKIGKKLMIMEG